MSVCLSVYAHIFRSNLPCFSSKKLYRVEISSLLMISSYVTHYNIITYIIFSYRTCFVLHIPFKAAPNLQEMIYIHVSSVLFFKS